MYFDRPFLRVLMAADAVLPQADALVLITDGGETERRIPYVSLSDREKGATLHFFGMRFERLQREGKA